MDVLLFGRMGIRRRRGAEHKHLTVSPLVVEFEAQCRCVSWDASRCIPMRRQAVGRSEARDKSPLNAFHQFRRRWNQRTFQWKEAKVRFVQNLYRLSNWATTKHHTLSSLVRMAQKQLLVNCDHNSSGVIEGELWKFSFRIGGSDQDRIAV